MHGGLTKGNSPNHSVPKEWMLWKERPCFQTCTWLQVINWLRCTHSWVPLIVSDQRVTDSYRTQVVVLILLFTWIHVMQSWQCTSVTVTELYVEFMELAGLSNAISTHMHQWLVLQQSLTDLCSPVAPSCYIKFMEPALRDAISTSMNAMVPQQSLMHVLQQSLTDLCSSMAAWYHYSAMP